MSCHDHPVNVLLPTYNGEHFLAAQLASVLAQRDIRLRILLRDDGSTDSTVDIAKALAAQHDVLQVHTGARLGVVGNVNALLHLAEKDGAAYFAMADQDDVWHANKISAQMDAMHALEQIYGSDVPLLVCSDARCVDAEGAFLQSSFLAQLGIPRGWGQDFRHALVMSWTLGCSCLGNAALRRMALPLPAAEDIYMHDWWLLLVAACFGAVQCIDEPLLDYRQHTGNVLGAKSKGSFLQRLAASKRHAQRTQRQARTFLERFQLELSTAQREILCDWADMPEGPRLYRLWHCWRGGFGKPGIHFFLT